MVEVLAISRVTNRSITAHIPKLSGASFYYDCPAPTASLSFLTLAALIEVSDKRGNSTFSLFGRAYVVQQA